MKMSIISPVFEGENMIVPFVESVSQALNEHDFEIVLVDDGSLDKSWNVIEEICAVNVKIKGLKLSRNFGQHYAITAGITVSDGDYLILIDNDLQDYPASLISLINKANQGSA